MSERTQLHERLRTYRLAHHFTQQELGDRLGVTAQAVSKWETGMGTPDITLLPKLAKLFQCSIDSLFYGDGTTTDLVKNKTVMGASYSKIESSDMRGVVMRDVNMEGAEIFDSCLNDASIHHGGMANLSLKQLDLDGLTIGFSQMNGALFHDLGGHTEPIRFMENDLKQSVIDRCDLSGVTITDCNLSGLRITGSVLKDSWLLQPEDYKPLQIEDVNLRNGVIKSCELMGLKLQACTIDGVPIDEISLEKLLKYIKKVKLNCNTK